MINNVKTIKNARVMTLDQRSVLYFPSLHSRRSLEEASVIANIRISRDSFLALNIFSHRAARSDLSDSF